MPVPEQLAAYAFQPGNKMAAQGKRLTLAGALEKLGFKTVEEAVALFRDPKTSTYVRWDILKELLQYQYPKQKSVVIGNPDGTQDTIHIQWDMADARAKLNEAHEKVIEAVVDEDEDR